MTARTRRGPLGEPPQLLIRTSPGVICSLIPSGVRKAPSIATEKVAAGVKSELETGESPRLPISKPGSVGVAISPPAAKEAANGVMTSEMAMGSERIFGNSIAAIELNNPAKTDLRDS